MAGGMVFRKDCEDCGRSFLTPDRKAKLCPRCAGESQKRDQRPRSATEKLPSKFLAKAKAPIEKQSPAAPAADRKPQPAWEGKPPETGKALWERKGQEGTAGKPEVAGPLSVQMPGAVKSENLLTPAQEREIIDRYQKYVYKMERPPKGRRKTIAFEIGLPYRSVMLTIRRWKLSQGEDLNREEKFLTEKTYFSLLEKESSFSGLKERVSQETGLNHWKVSRHIDVLHDEEKLGDLPDVSPDQETAILAEYHSYLSGPAPPGSSLHALIAEKTGVTPKQVHKVLVTYRLGRFRELRG